MNPRSWGSLVPGALAAVLLATLLAPLVASPVAAQEADGQETVSLDELNDSGVTGVATLVAIGEQTELEIRLTGAVAEHPTYVHASPCAAIGPDIVDPVPEIEVGEADPDGFIRSTVDLPLSELRDGMYSIVVHAAADQPETYLACGNIGAAGEASAGQEQAAPAAAGDAAASAGGTGNEPVVTSGKGVPVVHELTTTGVGSAAGWPAGLPALVAALGLAAAAAAGIAARRPGPGRV